LQPKLPKNGKVVLFTKSLLTDFSELMGMRLHAPTLENIVEVPLRAFKTTSTTSKNLDSMPLGSHLLLQTQRTAITDIGLKISPRLMKNLGLLTNSKNSFRLAMKETFGF